MAMASQQIHEYEQCVSRGSTDRLPSIAAPLMCYEAISSLLKKVCPATEKPGATSCGLL